MRMLFKTQESKSKYKHQAFPYYNQEEVENSSNQKNSDPESSGNKKPMARQNASES